MKACSLFVASLLTALLTVPAGAAKKPAAAAAPVRVDIALRHALQGPAREALIRLAARFNDAQQGRASVRLEDLAGVADRRHLPQLALLDADDGVAYFDTLPRYKPLYKLMAETREKFEPRQFLPLLVEAVDDPAGRLQALPLGLALPVLFWNKEAYARAGLDPERAPQTWQQLQNDAGKLFDAGSRCPYTTSRFTWVHLENLSAQNGEPVSVRDARGVMRVVLNRMVDVKHVSLLASWQKSRYFHYFGRADEADRKFLAGECAILSGASSLATTAKAASFPVGMAALPRYDDVYGATPDRLLPDGLALWLLAGNKKAEDLVAARFISFLLAPASQREWLQGTGFLPMTAYALDTVPVSREVRQMLTRASNTARGKHGYGLARQREILAEEIETVWRDGRAPMEALNAAVGRINAGDKP